MCVCVCFLVFVWKMFWNNCQCAQPLTHGWNPNTRCFPCEPVASHVQAMCEPRANRVRTMFSGSSCECCCLPGQHKQFTNSTCWAPATAKAIVSAYNTSIRWTSNRHKLRVTGQTISSGTARKTTISNAMTTTKHDFRQTKMVHILFAWGTLKRFWSLEVGAINNKSKCRGFQLARVSQTPNQEFNDPQCK